MGKGIRYGTTTRRLVGAELRRLYEDGASMQALAQATGRSAGYVRELLLEAGATLRSPGRRQRSTEPRQRPSAPDTMAPALEKGRWYAGADRRRIGAQLREWYEDGASIRDLAELTGRSYGFLHRLLLESGATLRGRGGDNTRNWLPPPAP